MAATTSGGGNGGRDVPDGRVLEPHTATMELTALHMAIIARHAHIVRLFMEHAVR